jgi:FkbM family methyltransferase
MPRTPSIPHAPLTEEVKGRYGIVRFFAKDTVIGAALRAYGEWAENELRFLRHVIPSGGTVIDAGAFVGTHALAFARRVGDDGQVHAFEPQSRSFALLETNIRANGLHHVHLRHAAVGAAPGQTRLEVMKADEAANFAGLGVRPTQADAGTSDEVPVVAIDSLGLQRCDLIKLDVEGAEDAVLRGAVETITRLKPVIYADCNSLADGARSFAELTSLGYALFMHVADAFNPDNWLGARENMFGVAREAAIVGVPCVRSMQRPSPSPSC